MHTRLTSQVRPSPRVANPPLISVNSRDLGPSRCRPVTTLTLGIRREDPSRIWERRCPVSPTAVKELISMGMEVRVQHCTRRVWTSDEYRAAGAIIVQDVSTSDIIVGIKEVPISELSLSSTNEQTHFMFSHTHKGQPYNMPLLSQFARGGRLIDYELLTSHPAQGAKRTVSFGWLAGAAGAVEGLAAYGRHLLSVGIASPLLHVVRPYMHPSLSEMRSSLNHLGHRISTHGTPTEAGPLVVTVTGAGQVASGALSMLTELPHTVIEPNELSAIVADQAADCHKVLYLLQAPPSVYFERKDGKSYSRDDYYSNPSLYRSQFHKKIAPFTSLLINGAGWKPGFPRLMDNGQLDEALTLARSVGPGRFGVVADVSCDLEGGLQFVTSASTIINPSYTIRPATVPPELPGLEIMSIDILPAELPEDASVHFSQCIMPHLRALARHRLGLPPAEEDPDLLQALDRATIARHGKLLPPHQWLYAHLASVGKPEYRTKPTISRTKTILLLGSGMVAKPVIEKISKRPDLALLIGSNNVHEAKLLAAGLPGVQFARVDASDASSMDSMIQKADVVISLLPAAFHPAVAELCLKQRKHLVTASYVSPEMRTLHERAILADVLLLNECGLDPGIDHCAAVDLITRVQSSGKRVASFISFCGGLPAPDCSNVPLGYKFSWAPMGVLLALKNAAAFKLMNKVIQIPGNSLLQSSFSDVPVCNALALEGLANRNSLDYARNLLWPWTSSANGITIEGDGFAALMSSFERMGLLDGDRPLQLNSWSSLADLSMERVLACSSIRDKSSRKSALMDLLPEVDIAELLDSMEWLGLVPQSELYLSKDASLPSLPTRALPPIDLMSALLAHRLRYLPHERDMVVLSHEVVATERERGVYGPLGQNPHPGLNTEVHTSQLITYGDAGSSAMARTVGLPVALAALRIIDGTIDLRGVRSPTEQSIYKELLSDLAEDGITLRETVRRGVGIGEKLLECWRGTTA